MQVGPVAALCCCTCRTLRMDSRMTAKLAFRLYCPNYTQRAFFAYKYDVSQVLFTLSEQDFGVSLGTPPRHGLHAYT
jgi:hypothetical protein